MESEGSRRQTFGLRNTNHIRLDLCVSLHNKAKCLAHTITVNALVASDEVIVPTATDYLSYKGLELLIDTINNVKENLNESLKIKGVIATMYDKRTNHANEVLEALNEEFDVLGTVKISVAAKDSILANEPLIRFAKSNDVTKEYIKIAEELL